MATTVLAIIPARGGSKSVPLKNIKILQERPLIAYTIEAARTAASSPRLVVSTDHEDIANTSRSLGTEVITRPPELSGDEAPTEWALIHVLDALLEREGYLPDVVLTLEPTSPFRTSGTIDRCIRMFDDAAVDSVLGVVETRSCYGRIINGRFEHLFPGQPRRRQDREPLYKECSTIYGTRTEVLKRKRSVLGDNLFAIVVPDEEAFDINVPRDFELAELLMRRRTT